MDSISKSFNFRKKKVLRKYITACVPGSYILNIALIIYSIIIFAFLITTINSHIIPKPFYNSVFFPFLCPALFYLVAEFSYPYIAMYFLTKKNPLKMPYITLVFTPTEYTYIYPDMDKSYSVPYTKLTRIKFKRKTISFYFPMPKTDEYIKFVFPTKYLTKNEKKVDTPVDNRTKIIMKNKGDAGIIFDAALIYGPTNSPIQSQNIFSATHPVLPSGNPCFP